MHIYRLFTLRRYLHLVTYTPGYDSEAFEQLLLKEKSILVAPGKPFGENGNQYVRVSLALDDKQLEEAANRLTQLRYLYER